MKKSLWKKSKTKKRSFDAGAICCGLGGLCVVVIYLSIAQLQLAPTVQQVVWFDIPTLSVEPNSGDVGLQSNALVLTGKGTLVFGQVGKLLQGKSSHIFPAKEGELMIQELEGLVNDQTILLSIDPGLPLNLSTDLATFFEKTNTRFVLAGGLVIP